MKEIFKYGKYLSYISQVGISFITPILCMILFTIFLKKTFHFGDWIVMLGMLLGVASGYYSVIQLLKKVMNPKEQDRKEDPHG